MNRGISAYTKSNLNNNQNYDLAFHSEVDSDEESNISFNEDVSIAKFVDSNNEIPNSAVPITVVNVPPPTTDQFINKMALVPVPVLAKFNNTITHYLVANPDKSTIVIDEKRCSFRMFKH